jgi:broad specificity phosphatase PhoE
MKLYIVRHGNTFKDSEVPRRIGQRTDLPLVESGMIQAHKLGKYFKNNSIKFDLAFSSNLIRTTTTAEIVLSYNSSSLKLNFDVLFTEIDHGMDEGKTDNEIIKRIGSDALYNWETLAIEPEGWSVNKNDRILGWIKFLEEIKKLDNVLIVTSNGAARIALIAFDLLNKVENIKLKTGSFGILEIEKNNSIKVVEWGVQP